MEGGRWEVGEKKEKNLLQQRYLPNAWSRNTNTAAVMTDKDPEEDMLGGEHLFHPVFGLIGT